MSYAEWPDGRWKEQAPNLTLRSRRKENRMNLNKLVLATQRRKTYYFLWFRSFFARASLEPPAVPTDYDLLHSLENLTSCQSISSRRFLSSAAIADVYKRSIGTFSIRHKSYVSDNIPVNSSHRSHLSRRLCKMHQTPRTGADKRRRWCDTTRHIAIFPFGAQMTRFWPGKWANCATNGEIHRTVRFACFFLPHSFSVMKCAISWNSVVRPFCKARPRFGSCHFAADVKLHFCRARRSAANERPEQSGSCVFNLEISCITTAMLVMFRNRLLRSVRVRAERCLCRAVFIVFAESYTEIDAPQPNANSMRLLL